MESRHPCKKVRLMLIDQVPNAVEILLPPAVELHPIHGLDRFRKIRRLVFVVVIRSEYFASVPS